MTAPHVCFAEGMYKFSFFGGAAPSEGKVAGGGFPRLIAVMDVRSGKYLRKGNILVMRISASFLSGEPLLIADSSLGAHACMYHTSRSY